MSSKLDKLTPREIVAELDKYIVGQHDAKRNVAIALRNRWRRMNSTPEMQKEIIPNNIIIKAPSAELRPDQKDSDSLPDYDLLDKVLYQYI